MSEIKVNSIKGVGASTAAITVDNTAGTCTANLTNRTNKNLILNGDMTIAQRSTSAVTTDGYGSVDRYQVTFSGHDEALTHQQVDVASGTTPYTLGFRKALKITNGNQTSGAGAADYAIIYQPVEAQNMATSGWNNTSSSSYVTLSFWCKSSVAQSYPIQFKSADGTAQNYPMETGSLSADTWTKITKTIPGASNVQFDTDNNTGLEFMIWLFGGTNYSDSSVTFNQWGAYSGSARFTDMTSTWWTTNDATFELTGVQLEVGSVATDFEHRSFAQELQLCKRYYETFTPNLFPLVTWHVGLTTSKNQYFFEVEKRANPTCSHSGTFNSSSGYGGDPSFSNITTQGVSITGFSLSANEAIYLHNSSNALCIFNSELQ